MQSPLRCARHPAYRWRRTHSGVFPAAKLTLGRLARSVCGARKGNHFDVADPDETTAMGDGVADDLDIGGGRLSGVPNEGAAHVLAQTGLKCDARLVVRPNLQVRKPLRGGHLVGRVSVLNVTA